MTDHSPTFGALLQSWRHRRRMSQLGLALGAGISQRHLSFVETGRASPSREMVLHLAEHLDVPPRERNALLLAAGFAPLLPDRSLDHPDLVAARRAVVAILRGHAPHPALAVDRHWTLVAANDAVAPLLAGVAPFLLGPATNVLRLSLHPEGLAPRIRNLRDWRAHLLARLARQIEAVPDPVLVALLEELKGYPLPPNARPPTPAADLYGGLAMPLELAASPESRPLRLISTTTVFGTALDIGLSELAIESFFPADAETAQALARLPIRHEEPGSRRGLTDRLDRDRAHLRDSSARPALHLDERMPAPAPQPPAQSAYSASKAGYSSWDGNPG